MLLVHTLILPLLSSWNGSKSHCGLYILGCPLQLYFVSSNWASSHVAGYPVMWHVQYQSVQAKRVLRSSLIGFFFREDLTWAFSPRYLISEGTWGIGFLKASWQIELQLDEVKIKWGLRNGKQRKSYSYLSLAFCNKSSLWK